jgi:hypothetical protein
MNAGRNAGINTLCLVTLLIYAQCPLWGQSKSPAARRAMNTRASVSFVGCASDGQVGPLKAPTGRSRRMAIPAKAAQRLAYYKAENGFGVLAPKGWHCFGTYGSNGANLYVSPSPINASDLFSTTWKGFPGPVIQISSVNGGTSGRFEVARIIARVFPDRKEFVDNVIAEGVEPASSFPSGPHPADTLKYRGKNIVEFLTAARKEGLGTQSRLLKNNSPISGVAILFGEEPSLLQLSMRLPSQTSDLAQFIIAHAEREAERFRD